MSKKEIETKLEKLFDAKKIQTLVRRGWKKDKTATIEELFIDAADEICKGEDFIQSHELLYKFVIDMQNYIKFKVETEEHISNIYVLYEIDEDGIITVPSVL